MRAVIFFLIYVAGSFVFASESESFNVMFSPGPFASGFKRQTGCEERLQNLLRGSVPEFKKLSPGEKVRELHHLADSIFQDSIRAVQGKTKWELPSSEELTKIAPRLKFFSDTSRKKLEPYVQELLVVANKLGTLASFSHTQDLTFVRSLADFVAFVLALPAPDEKVNHALRAVSFGHVAVLKSNFLRLPIDRLELMTEIAEISIAGIQEDSQGFMAGSAVNPTCMILAHMFDMSIMMTNTEIETLDLAGESLVSAIEPLMGISLHIGNQSGDFGLFQSQFKQVESLMNLASAEKFPHTKRELEKLVKGFKPPLGGRH